MGRQYFEADTFDVRDPGRFVILCGFENVLGFGDVRSRAENILVDRGEGHDLESHCVCMNDNPNPWIGVLKTRFFNLIDVADVCVDYVVWYTSSLHHVLESQSSEQLRYIHGYSLPC